MIRYLIVILIILFTNNLVISDGIEVSEPYEVIDGRKFYIYENNVLIAIKKQHTQISLQKFNTKTLELDTVNQYYDFPSEIEIEGIINFNAKHYMFYSKSNNIAGCDQLFYVEIDILSGCFIGDRRSLVTTDRKISNSIHSFSMFGTYVAKTKKFNIKISQDSSKLLVYYKQMTQFREKERNKYIIGIDVFDENLYNTLSKDYKMSHQAMNMSLLDCNIDNKGNVYLVSKVSNDVDDRKKDTPDYTVEVRKIDTKKNIDSLSIDLDNKFINQMYAVENINGDMIFAGYYGHDKYHLGVSGIFFFKINSKFQVINKIANEFPSDVLNQYEKKSIKNKRDEIGYLSINDLLLDNEGNLVVIGEQFYFDELSHQAFSKDNAPVKEHSFNPSFFMPSIGVMTYNVNATYYINDIVVSKLDSIGNSLWTSRLPKGQSGGIILNLSYKQIIDDNGDYYFLFLDNIKNKNLSFNVIPEYSKSVKNGMLSSYKVINQTGEIKKTDYFDMKYLKKMRFYQFSPNRIEYIGKNQFIVELYKKKKEDVLIKANL